MATSWERHPHALTFLRRRATRIFPALLVVVLFTVCIVGPLASSQSVTTYFSSRQTLRYGLHNTTMLFGMEHHLPGVFTTHPNGSVNGSLWTLPYELWAYVLVMAAGIVGALRRTTVVLAALLVAVFVFHYGVDLHRLPLDQTLFGLTARDGLELGMLFLLGVAIARLRHRIDVRVLALPGVVAMVAALLLDAPLLFLLGMGIATIGVGAFGGRVRAGSGVSAIRRTASTSARTRSSRRCSRRARRVRRARCSRSRSRCPRRSRTRRGTSWNHPRCAPDVAVRGAARAATPSEPSSVLQEAAA